MIAIAKFRLNMCGRGSANSPTGGRQLEIMLETPKRGRGAQCPDPLIPKSGYFVVKFFGSNASALNTPLT